MLNQDKTHFGYQQIPVSEKVKKVDAVFDSVVEQYDMMNDLMSLGIHRLWKRYTVEIAGIKGGQRILDLAGGTGDLSARFAAVVGRDGQVVLADINQAMLNHGRDRMIDRGITNIEYIQANAEQLPFPDNYFDRCTMAFGLRNVTNKQAALDSVFRVLKPTGKLVVLEFSHPTSRVVKFIYDRYSFNVIPLVGKLVVNDRESYRYLAESIRVHPDQTTLQHMVEQAGFEKCDFLNLSGGIVALHWGYKI